MFDPQMRTRQSSTGPAMPGANGPYVVGESIEMGFDLRTLVDDAAEPPNDPARTIDSPPCYGELIAASGHVTRAGYCSPRDEQELDPACLDHSDTIYDGGPPAALPRVSALKPRAADTGVVPRAWANPPVLEAPRGGMSPEIVRYALLVALLAVVGTVTGTALGLLFRAL